MKAQDLVNLIDKLVEKRVDAKVRQLIKEEVSSQVNATMGKMLIEMVQKSSPSSVERRDYVSQQTLEPTPINTNNPRLNAVLAETARHSRQLPRESRGSLAELLDGGFDKIGGSVEPAYGQVSTQQPVEDNTNVGFLKQIVSETIVPQQISVLDSEEVPDVLKGVFKKDFRSVIRKMDEQKKSGSPGLINPQMVLSG